MRIGIVTHNYPLYKGQSKDAGNFIYHFAHELSKKVEKVFVFCPNYAGKKEDYQDIPVTWFNWWGGNQKLGNSKWWNPFDLLLTANLLFTGRREILKFIKENQIDTVLSFWNIPGGVFAMSAKDKLGTPYVTWALGSDIYVYGKLPLLKMLVVSVLQNTNKAFGNSLDICSRIKNISKVNAKFLPTANSLKLAASKKINLPQDKFNFLFLGRLESVKGPDILIEAVKILSSKRSDFTVSMIGGGSMFDQLKYKLRDENLKVVSLLGYIEDQDLVNGYLLACDALIIPSRSESFPLVITEALQANLPIVGSSVGDMPTFIPENKLGYIFNREDPLQLSEMMSKMIENGKKIKKQNAKKIKVLVKDFQLNRIVDNFLKEIKSLN
ncbi:MAG: glycosyltransferase [Candidatus Daviesbacteria bacterium]|nr:MAG: glycosyltransferase [Candidatus Daviesbacteria bacterium]